MHLEIEQQRAWNILVGGEEGSCEMAVSEFGREGKRPGPGEVGGFQERLPCASSSLSLRRAVSSLSSYSGIRCGKHLTFRDGICLAQHHRGPLPFVALMPESHPGRRHPAVGWADLRLCHPSPSSLSALLFLPADTASGCLGFGQRPGGLEERILTGSVRVGGGVERHWGKARLGQEGRLEQLRAWEGSPG